MSWSKARCRRSYYDCSPPNPPDKAAAVAASPAMNWLRFNIHPVSVWQPRSCCTHAPQTCAWVERWLLFSWTTDWITTTASEWKIMLVFCAKDPKRSWGKKEVYRTLVQQASPWQRSHLWLKEPKAFMQTVAAPQRPFDFCTCVCVCACMIILSWNVYVAPSWRSASSHSTLNVDLWQTGTVWLIWMQQKTFSRFPCWQAADKQ